MPQTRHGWTRPNSCNLNPMVEILPLPPASVLVSLDDGIFRQSPAPLCLTIVGVEESNGDGQAWPAGKPCTAAEIQIPHISRPAPRLGSLCPWFGSGASSTYVRAWSS